VVIFDFEGTIQGEIFELLLEKLGPKIDPDEAEEIAQEIIELTTRNILSLLGEG